MFVVRIKQKRKMKYYFFHLKRKNKIRETCLVTNIKSNPKQMFHIDSFKITLDNNINVDIFQNLISNSCMYLIKNTTGEEELENIVEKENFLDMLNSNIFCQTPFCLLEYSIVKNNNNTSDIIFTLNWNNLFSNPLILANGYIVAIKINSFIQKDYIKNYFISINYSNFVSHDD